MVAFLQLSEPRQHYCGLCSAPASEVVFISHYENDEMWVCIDHSYTYTQDADGVRYLRPAYGGD